MGTTRAGAERERNNESCEYRPVLQHVAACVTRAVQGSTAVMKHKENSIHPVDGSTFSVFPVSRAAV